MTAVAAGIFAASGAVGLMYAVRTGRTGRWPLTSRSTSADIGQQRLPPAASGTGSYSVSGSAAFIRGSENLKAAYSQIRDRPGLSRIRAIWSADYGDIQDYFEKEKGWLERNDKAIIERVISTTSVRPDQREFLEQLASAHPNLHLYTAEISDFELFLCRYDPGTDLSSLAAIFVVNASHSRNPEFGIVIDATLDPALLPFCQTLENWFVSLPKDRVYVQPRGPVPKGGDAGDHWTEHAKDYDKNVSRDSTLPFLKQFIVSEDDFVSEVIRSVDGDVSFVEFGAGTGRSITYLRSLPDIAKQCRYFIGFDRSPRMTEVAIQKRELARTKAPYTSSHDKTFFFTLNAADSLRNFWNGQIAVEPDLNDETQVRQIGIDPSAYQESRKVIACLLNTLGVLDRITRRQVFRNMVTAASLGDMIVLSVFAAEAFQKHAPRLYPHIAQLVGVPDPSNEKYYNGVSADFTAGSYYSHWFTDSEVRELIESSGARLVDSRDILLDQVVNDVIGRCYICQKRQ